MLQSFLEGGTKYPQDIEDWRDLGGREEKREKKGGGRIKYERRQGRSVAVGGGVPGVATRKYQMSRKQEALKTGKTLAEIPNKGERESVETISRD